MERIHTVCLIREHIVAGAFTFCSNSNTKLLVNMSEGMKKADTIYQKPGQARTPKTHLPMAHFL